MKRHAKRILEHLLGPTGSILIHVAIIVAMVKFIFFEPPQKDAEVEVVMMEIEEANIEEIKKELQELKEIQMIDALAPPDLTMDDVQPEEVEDFEVAEPEVDFAALEIVDSIQSSLVIKGIYAGRSDAGRAGGLKRAGRWGGQTEAAVLRALEWLKRNQNADGSWDTKNHSAMTGLGLLTFLAHGETPSSEAYGPTVEKAIRFLVDTQEKNGSWPHPKMKVSHEYEVYGHAIATYAVSEAYGLTRIPILFECMNRSVEVIVKGQQSGGGWDYDYRKSRAGIPPSPVGRSRP